MEIQISAGELKFNARLNETYSADKVLQALPVTSRVNIWGEEIYFSIPVDVELENPSEVVNAGEIAYWPPGKAMCIFFGKTPASKGEEIRAASPVNIIGRIEGDLKLLKKVKQGQKIVVQKV